MTAERSDPEPATTRSLPAAALKRLERAGLLTMEGDERGWRLTTAGESAAVDFLTSRTASAVPWVDVETDDPCR